MAVRRRDDFAEWRRTIERKLAALHTAAASRRALRIVPQTYTTATRPAATSVPEGTHIFDTDLDRPLWSTGTQWVDATGNPPA